MEQGRVTIETSDPKRLGRDRRARTKRVAAALALLAGLALAVTVGQQQGVDLDPRALRARIQDFGWLAPVVFICAAALRPFLLLPSWPIMAAGGLLFGIAWGTVWGALGFSIGALMAFSIARGLGRDAVVARLRGRAARIDAFLAERGPLWMALYTGLPITPLTPVHVSAGLSGMTLAGFAVAVASGFLPRAALFSFFGDSVAQGDWGRMWIALAGIGIAAAVGIALTRRLAGVRRGRGDSSNRLEGKS